LTAADCYELSSPNVDTCGSNAVTAYPPSADRPECRAKSWHPSDAGTNYAAALDGD
jgi:hypothetical protein